MRNKVIYGRTLLKTTGMVFSPDCSLYVALSVQDPVMSSSTKYICITVPRRLGNILFLFDVKQWRPFQIFCFLILLACSSLYLWFQHALCLWRFWCKDASSFLVQKSHSFEGKEPSVSSHVQKEKTTKQHVFHEALWESPWVSLRSAEEWAGRDSMQLYALERSQWCEMQISRSRWHNFRKFPYMELAVLVISAISRAASEARQRWTSRSWFACSIVRLQSNTRDCSDLL